MPDPFAVDVEHALDALVAAWEAAGYEEIGHVGGMGWYAYHRDARDVDAIEAGTPDELSAKIRQDWLARQVPDGIARKYLY
jgi:hypothetical protein